MCIDLAVNFLPVCCRMPVRMHSAGESSTPSTIANSWPPTTSPTTGTHAISIAYYCSRSLLPLTCGWLCRHILGISFACTNSLSSCRQVRRGRRRGRWCGVTRRLLALSPARLSRGRSVGHRLRGRSRARPRLAHGHLRVRIRTRMASFARSLKIYPSS